MATSPDAGAFARLDRSKFFAAIRPLFGKLTVAQVAGLNRLIDAFLLYALILDRRHLAYILATSFHETGRRMQPVREGFADSTAQAISRLNAAWAAGKLKWVKTPYWRAGWFGRGDVQLTHEANYRGAIRDAVLKVFSIDIHADPDAVLRGDISAFVVIEGVTRGVTKRPDFTAFAIEDFLNATTTDYDNARKSVNPGEKDSYRKVGDYARRFEAALVAGGMPLTAARMPGALGKAPASLPPTAPSSPPKVTPEPAPTGGLLRSGAQATGGAVRSGLAGLYDLIHTTFRRA